MIASSTNGDIEFVIVLPFPMSLDRSSTAAGEDKVIGTAGIGNESTGETELMLHRHYRGQGYMAEVLTTLVPWLWQKGVQTMVADVDPRNDRSSGVLNKFDFVETRREKKSFETDVGWCDGVYLELWTPRRF